MEEYFSTTLNKLKTNNYENVYIVLGNESCDLDSAVSSLVYAIFLYWHHQQLQCELHTTNDKREVYTDDIFVSVLDVHREDYALKTEVVFCLQQHNITEKDLMFSDDLAIEELLTDSKTKLILVDHHILSKKYDHLAPSVTEIIDHRPLDSVQWMYKDDVKSTIEVVGSCCTLIAQRVKDLSASILKDTDFFCVYPPCADMLHSVILLDTVNFSKEVNKGTQHDEDIVLFLECLLMSDCCERDRTTKFDRLLTARCDVSSLNSEQLLRKDLKIYGDIFVPSFPILVEEFLRKPNALQAVTEALASRNCNVALLLGMDLCDGLRRDGTIISSSQEDKAQALAKFLLEWSNPPLQLNPDPEVHCLYFRQMNLSASRKQYVPALNEFINNWSD